ncbi:SGNH/GDSL hydrolase family protein [Ralstonia nicotianae]|uniref:SGNH/GDSL hydrolase family protein n=1 Tax=Ralstonia pseudosolanacearum TaxID=1310165 RepID=UPI00336A1B01
MKTIAKSFRAFVARTSVKLRNFRWSFHGSKVSKTARASRGAAGLGAYRHEDRQRAGVGRLPVRFIGNPLERVRSCALGVERGILASRQKKVISAIMKGSCAAFFCAFIFTSSGCGGGDSSAAESAPTAPAPAAKPSILIEAYGDSTMRGLQTPDWATVLFSPTSVTQDRLRSTYGAKADITVSNEAVNGRRAIDLVNGTDGKHLPWAQTAANSRASIVIFNYAINDATGQFPVSSSDYRATLIFLITEAKKYGKVPVLEEPNPICSSATASAKLDSFVAVMRDVATAQGVSLIQQYDIIKSIPDWQTKYGADCIHPLLEIYQGKAQRQADVVVATAGTMLNQ